MAEISIQEGKKLLAEFDGWIISSSGKTYRKSNQEAPYRSKDIHYFTSWDWLIPVVQKIARITPKKGTVLKQYNLFEEIIEAMMTLDRDKVFKATCQFLQWYNNTIKQ